MYIVVPSVECSREFCRTCDRHSSLGYSSSFVNFLGTRAGLSWARRPGIQRSLELSEDLPVAEGLRGLRADGEEPLLSVPRSFDQNTRVSPFNF